MKASSKYSLVCALILLTFLPISPLCFHLFRFPVIFVMDCESRCMVVGEVNGNTNS